MLNCAFIDSNCRESGGKIIPVADKSSPQGVALLCNDECRVVDGRVIISRVYRGAKLRGIVAINLQTNTLTTQTRFLLGYVYYNTPVYQYLSLYTDIN